MKTKDKLLTTLIVLIISTVVGFTIVDWIRVVEDPTHGMSKAVLHTFTCISMTLLCLKDRRRAHGEQSIITTLSIQNPRA